MEEDKAAAYYDELTRKGEGAARFKQGLGFSSSSASVVAERDSVPARGSALPSSSSSFLNQFVRASSPSSSVKLEKDSELRSIKEKLKKKPDDQKQPRFSERSRIELTHRESSGRRRSRSRERHDIERRHRRRSRSRDRDDKERRHRRRSRSRSRDRYRERDSHGDRERRRIEDEKNGKMDCSNLIEGYDRLSAAERVKAKMKLQLAETAKKDTMTGAGWERFDFDKDAPVDDEEVEVADDDAALVKQIGQSFRFSAIEGRREEQIKAAHDEAMFGAPTRPLSVTTEDDLETNSTKNDSNGSNAATSLLSEKVLAKQQGSWRDRARKAN